ncbi:MAG: DUF1192 domain-containing protein, partial [Candidatus Puniceispirillaceae bacterium]
ASLVRSDSEKQAVIQAGATDLTTANIEDLEAYISALEAEIERVGEIIRHKQSVGSLAESLFSKSDS